MNRSEAPVNRRDFVCGLGSLGGYATEGALRLRNGMSMREWRECSCKELELLTRGWTTVAPTGKVEHAWVGNYPKSSYLEQAQYLVRMYLLARQQGVEFVCQYDLRDDGPKRHYTEHNFGLLNFDGSPKPAYAAVAAMTRIVGESAPCGDLSSAPGLYRLYRFEKDEVGGQKSEVGDEVLVGWSVCGSEAIVLPKECRGAKVRVYDLFGNEKAKAVSDGQVALTECPVYMVVSRK